MFCKKCGLQVPDQSAFCGGCGTSQTSAQSVGSGTAAEPALAKAPEPATLNVFPKFETRYGDGYKAAQLIIGFGNTIKVVGAIAGAIIVIGGLIASSQMGMLSTLIAFLAVVFGGALGLVLYVCGVMICAQGQLLLANLDCAVNGSPFLDNSKKASIMSLSGTTPQLSHLNISSDLTALIARNEASRCEVITSPEGAEVSVDGQKSRIAPCRFVLKRNGTLDRIVTVSLTGYKDVVLKYLPDGTPITINLSLEQI